MKKYLIFKIIYAVVIVDVVNNHVAVDVIIDAHVIKYIEAVEAAL